MKTRYVLLFSGLLFSFLFITCSKMNDLHEEYLLKGEKIYVAQPDSVHIYPGLERVIVHYWVSDPKAKKIKIFWNNGLDSVMADIPNILVDKPGVVSIEQIAPKDYSFKIVTYNARWENSSIPLEIVTEVYSENYLNKLFPRQIEYAHYLTPDSVYVRFRKSTDKSVGAVIRYTNLSGEQIQQTVSNDTNFVVLEKYKENIEVYTSFLPFRDALDTLYSQPKGFSKIDLKMNKVSFGRWNPPGIPYKQYSNAWKIENMWDNNYYETSYLQAGLTLPHDFTFDLGQLKKISRIKHFQRWTENIIYSDQQLKRFEVWGSATSDVTSDLSGWTLLGSFSSVKPSGKPVGQNDPEDIEYAREGEDFLIPGNPPEVRYIRYRVLEAWKGTAAIAIGELDFFYID